jgi:flagellar biosynthesis/type III secretory pathway protein FliH
LSDRPFRPLPLPELRRQVPLGEALPAPNDDTRVLREAHRIGRAILARAEARAREVEAAAAEQAHEVGVRTAFGREGPALRSAAGALVTAAARLDATRRELARLWTATLPEVSIAVAERVLRHELTIRPELLAHVVRDALGALGAAATIEIRLHPDDVGTIHRHRELLADVLGTSELRLETDPSVGRGGCVLESESLTLPAGIPQQIERALALLTEAEP